MGLGEDCLDLYWMAEVDGGTSLVRAPKGGFHDDGLVDTTGREVLVERSGGGLVSVDATGIYWRAGSGISRLQRQAP